MHSIDDYMLMQLAERLRSSNLKLLFKLSTDSFDELHFNIRFRPIQRRVTAYYDRAQLLRRSWTTLFDREIPQTPDSLHSAWNFVCILFAMPGINSCIVLISSIRPVRSARESSNLESFELLFERPCSTCDGPKGAVKVEIEYEAFSASDRVAKDEVIIGN